MTQHNNRFLKWIIGTLSTLLMIAGVALVRNEIKRAEFHAEVMEEIAKLRAENVALRTIQVRMGKDTNANTQWIVRWYSDLKVPERDQAQDLGIEDLQRRVRALEGR